MVSVNTYAGLRRFILFFDVSIHLALAFLNHEEYFPYFIFQVLLWVSSFAKPKGVQFLLELLNLIILILFFGYSIYTLPLVYTFTASSKMDNVQNSKELIIIFLYLVMMTVKENVLYRDDPRINGKVWVILWSYSLISFILKMVSKMLFKSIRKKELQKELDEVKRKFSLKKKLINKFMISFQSSFLDILMVSDEIYALFLDGYEKELKKIQIAKHNANKKISEFLGFLNPTLCLDRIRDSRVNLKSEELYEKLTTEFEFFKKLNRNEKIEVIIEVKKDIPALNCDLPKLKKIFISLYVMTIQKCKEGKIKLTAEYNKKTNVFSFSITTEKIFKIKNSEEITHLCSLLNGRIKSTFHDFIGQITFSCMLERSFTFTHSYDKLEKNDLITIIVGESDISRYSYQQHFSVEYGFLKKNMLFKRTCKEVIKEFFFGNYSHLSSPIILFFDLDNKLI